MVQESQTMKIDSLDKLQRQDHDTLTRLEAKIDNLIVDVKEMKDGTQAKLADHESRIKIIEDVHSKVSPEESVKKLEDLIQWRHDFGLTWKVVLFISSTVGAVVGFIISAITGIVGWFK